MAIVTARDLEARARACCSVAAGSELAVRTGGEAERERENGRREEGGLTKWTSDILVVIRCFKSGNTRSNTGNHPQFLVSLILMNEWVNESATHRITDCLIYFDNLLRYGGGTSILRAGFECPLQQRVSIHTLRVRMTSTTRSKPGRETEMGERQRQRRRRVAMKRSEVIIRAGGDGLWPLLFH